MKLKQSTIYLLWLIKITAVFQAFMASSRRCSSK